MKLPYELLQQLYDGLPLSIQVDIHNYLLIFDWYQSETDPQKKAELYDQLQALEQRFNISIIDKFDIKNTAPRESGQ
ncbi:hypothetical protein D3C74_407590 [compost metagenome]